MSEHSDLLGFVITADGCEANILVFAAKPSSAKTFALSTPWMCDFEWIELRCRRAASVDKYAEQFGAGAIECNNKSEQKVLRELGWYEIDGASEECSECGLYEWSDIPESELQHPVNGDPLWVYDGPVCAGCKSEDQPTT